MDDEFRSEAASIEAYVDTVQVSGTTALPSTSDPIGEILHLLRLTGTFYCVPELSAPWGMKVPDLNGQMVLVAVTEGACELELETRTVLNLRPGQLLLLPHGKPVILRSSVDAPVTPLFEIPATRHNPVYETMVFGGGGEVTRMTCGVLRVDDGTSQKLVGQLPSHIVLDCLNKNAGAWLSHSLKFLAEEARHPRPGGDIVLTRLTDILVVQVIRYWLETAKNEEIGWLSALREPKLGLALLAFHRAPQKAWTVLELAKVAGMSRSAFAARFKALVGEGTMQYVARCRMQLASRQLVETRRPLSEISHGLGYDSEAAFSRAFKRVIGKAPGSLRKDSKSS